MLFCPRSAPDFIDKKEFISNELHLKLCQELSDLDYRGTIRFSGFVEPLIDKKHFNLINMSRKYAPKCNIELVTNGDPLNEKRLKKLFDNGLNKILISVYDGKVDANKYEKMCNSLELNENQYIIRHRYLSESEDFGITLSNRSGMMENAEYHIKSLSEPLQKPCFIPSYTFFGLSGRCFNLPT